MSTETTKLTGAVGLVTSTGGNIAKGDVKSAVDKYEDYHGREDQSKSLNYADMVNKYYDLATSFYEYGWGASFHFAHRWKGETLNESIKRHEHFLALRLGLHPGMKVLDVGCGIGGPLREIVSFSGASVVGLNNNAYQVKRGQVLSEGRRCLDGRVNFVKADFMNIPFADNTFDAVYEIEATCHAPNAVDCYKEILRVLKPGQCFAGYEWCVTDAFDPKDPSHMEIKREIELGNGLPDIRSTTQVYDSLKAAGFEVLEAADLTQTAEVPWYQPLDPSFFSFSQFRLTAIGRALTTLLVQVLEKVKLAPEGSVKVQKFLEKGADGLVKGGRRELFTPMYYFVARKPAL